ncbi:hypothetical protein Syn6312_0458 [Synechococcus sp. PCC 6312]|nr:hypothetical protein Syn6312_0458 [Synechococcus sp. PCC 6312]
MELEGFILERVSGSHHIFKKSKITLYQASYQVTLQERHHYPTVIYPSPEGGFVAEVPALSGCLAQGETLEEMKPPHNCRLT